MSTQDKAKESLIRRIQQAQRIIDDPLTHPDAKKAAEEVLKELKTQLDEILAKQDQD